MLANGRRPIMNREYGYSQQTVDALTVERDKLEAENAALKEYRTAEARRRAELYAAKVDENHCLKKENEAVRADLTHWKSAWDTENGAVKKLERELDEAMRVIERLKDDAEWAIQTEIGRQHGCKVSIMEHLESIMNRAKATLSGKEGKDEKV
jgi:chromosome segregation ATPase